MNELTMAIGTIRTEMLADFLEEREKRKKRLLVANLSRHACVAAAIMLITCLSIVGLNYLNKKNNVKSWKSDLTVSVLNDYLPDEVFDGYRITSQLFESEGDSFYLTLSDGRNKLEITSHNFADSYTLITDFSDPDEYKFPKTYEDSIVLCVIGDKIAFYPSDLTEEILRNRSWSFAESGTGCINVNLLIDGRIVTYSYLGEAISGDDFLKMIRSTPKVKLKI